MPPSATFPAPESVLPSPSSAVAPPTWPPPAPSSLQVSRSPFLSPPRSSAATASASKSGTSLFSCIDGDLSVDPVFGCPAQLAKEMAAFRARCEEVLCSNSFAGWTVGRYFDHVSASDALRNAFVLPHAMGSFPMPDKAQKDMLVNELVLFWLIHGIVGSISGDRHTVVGGMYRYVEPLSPVLKAAGVDFRCDTRVLKALRFHDRIELHVSDPRHTPAVLTTDHVLFTIHATNVLPLLADDTESEEASALAGFKIQRARVLVHPDPSLMANDRAQWGAFNYVAPHDNWPSVRPIITSYPNRLARLPHGVPDTFVTMNPVWEPRPDSVISDAHLLNPVGVGGAYRGKAWSKSKENGVPGGRAPTCSLHTCTNRRGPAAVSQPRCFCPSTPSCLSAPSLYPSQRVHQFHFNILEEDPKY